MINVKDVIFEEEFVDLGLDDRNLHYPEKEFVKRFIEERKKKEFTSKQVSKKSGISQAEIKRIEEGEVIPSFNKIKKLAKVLNMRIKIELVEAEPDYYIPF